MTKLPRVDYIVCLDGEGSSVAEVLVVTPAIKWLSCVPLELQQTFCLEGMSGTLSVSKFSLCSCDEVKLKNYWYEASMGIADYEHWDSLENYSSPCCHEADPRESHAMAYSASFWPVPRRKDGRGFEVLSLIARSIFLSNYAYVVSIQIFMLLF